MVRVRVKQQHQPRSEAGSADSPFEGLATVVDPSGAAADDYRALRTSLMHALADTSRVVVVTSPGVAEGKTTVCANLGVTLAQAGKSTLIVDCDLRKPTMHKIFGLQNSRGLANVLAGEHGLHEASQESQQGPKVVAAGPTPSNPTDLLSSKGFAEFINQARQEFDYVLVDVPSVDLVPDPAIVAAQGDGVLLVLDARGTSKGSVRRAVRSLRTAGANVLGTVVNDTTKKAKLPWT